MKLAVDQNVSYDAFIKALDKGARIIAYQYIISMPVFMPVKRFSRLYFLQPGQKSSGHAWRYNLLNVLLGFWGLPFGPPVMLTTIIRNSKGGIDLSDDVLANLSKEAFDEKEIELLKPGKYFVEPGKSSLKELTKVVRKIKSDLFPNYDVYVGYFINTAKDEEPYYVMGIDCILNASEEEHIKKEIYKRFYKTTPFKVISLVESDYEHLERFKKESTIILD